MIDAPPDFSPALYRALHSDLVDLNDASALMHWEQHGEREQRICGTEMPRHDFLKLLAGCKSLLEIGPFVSPVVTGPSVKYFDVLNKKQLLDRANKIGRPIDHSVDIHFVSSTGDLSIVNEQFDIVLSSHCIEHQPDLVKHLQEVSRLLRPRGQYCLIVPDKRFCFDHFLPASSIADVILAYRESRKVHTIKSVIEHRAFITHNEASRHWHGDHSVPNYVLHPNIVAQAMEEFDASHGNYIDVHAWQFTPVTFKAIVSELNRLGLCNLRPSRIYPTPSMTFEFCAILEKME